MLSRFRPYVTVQVSPGRVVNSVVIEAYLGDEIDFDNAREAKGTTLIGSATVRPGNHLELQGVARTRWLDVDDARHDPVHLPGRREGGVVRLLVAVRLQAELADGALPRLRRRAGLRDDDRPP